MFLIMKRLAGYDACFVKNLTTGMRQCYRQVEHLGMVEVRTFRNECEAKFEQAEKSECGSQRLNVALCVYSHSFVLF